MPCSYCWRSLSLPLRQFHEGLYRRPGRASAGCLEPPSIIRRSAPGPHAIHGNRQAPHRPRSPPGRRSIHAGRGRRVRADAVPDAAGTAQRDRDVDRRCRWDLPRDRDEVPRHPGARRRHVAAVAVERCRREPSSLVGPVRRGRCRVGARRHRQRRLTRKHEGPNLAGERLQRGPLGLPSRRSPIGPAAAARRQDDCNR